MSQNIFQQACLVQLATSCWQGSKALEPAIMESRFKGKESEWLSGKKFLVNPESLGPIKAVVARARTFLERSALPFPVKSLTLVPKEMLTRIDEGLKKIKDEFLSEASEFVAGYEDERRVAETSLADLFCEADYPIDIRPKFRFEWRFFSLELPGKSRVLPAEVYEREKQKFQAMMEETREMAMAALREEFAGIVSHMAERLSGEEDGKPKRFKSSMLEKMDAFLGSFDDRNLFNDEILADLVARARTIVSDVSAENLRENEKLRNRISSKMGKLVQAIDKTMEDLPRRKIRLAA
jgi:hypothetical protein